MQTHVVSHSNFKTEVQTIAALAVSDLIQLSVGVGHLDDTLPMLNRRWP